MTAVKYGSEKWTLRKTEEFSIGSSGTPLNDRVSNGKLYKRG